jgi:hypothetical protein
MDRLIQQGAIEMMSEDFCGVWYYMTAWGSKP